MIRAVAMLAPSRVRRARMRSFRSRCALQFEVNYVAFEAMTPGGVSKLRIAGTAASSSAAAAPSRPSNGSRVRAVSRG